MSWRLSQKTFGTTISKTTITTFINIKHNITINMMKIIEAPTLATAYERTLKYILENGYHQQTEDKEYTVETDSITMYVDTPFRAERLSKYSPQKEMAAKEYARQLIEGSDNTFDYTYHGQLFKWSEYHINGEKKVHDQIKYIIEKLTDEPESRRAVAIVFDPMKHQYTEESVPCLQLVQFIYRNGRLHMRVIFRSNDMLSAAGLNMYALTHLQKIVADKLDYNVGSYTHIALVPHVYYIRDSKDMLLLIEGINKPKVPPKPEEEIRMQSWIIDNINKYAKTGGI
jgi:thymidylate synthase